MRLQHLPRYPIFFALLSLMVFACVILLFISFNGGMSSPGKSEHRTSSFKFDIWEKQSHKYCIPQPSVNYPSQETSTEGKDTVNRSSTLAIASQIFVVSLPRRTDRRTQMEILRTALGLQWKYVEAVDNSSPFIPIIMEEVRKQRVPDRANKKPFRWPNDINAQVYSSKPLGLGGSDNWTLPIDKYDTSIRPRERNISGSYNSTIASDPLTCSTEDDTPIEFEKSLREYKLLTSAKIACWSSHLLVIRDIAEDKNKGVSIVLEDDVDMGWDIGERLNGVWNLLPAGWDIVFIGNYFPPITTMIFLHAPKFSGHCWSNESHYSPLGPPNSAQNYAQELHTTLHPSFNPKCTHAYALSHSGARRLLLHLRYPPFSYSRALDQALSWLVQSGRLRAYSVIPSLVVQRKSGESDIMMGNQGMGSEWKEILEKSVFGQ